MEACNSLRDGTSLYQSDVFNYETDYDTTDKAIQSSRHVDVFKVWLMWRAKGPQGYEAQIEQLMDLSRYDSSVTVVCVSRKSVISYLRVRTCFVDATATVSVCK